MPIRSEIVIWDKGGIPQKSEVSGKHLVFWKSYETFAFSNAISIPQLVEKNADSIRAQYLAWIFKIGNTKIGRKKLVDCLKIRPGLSYWWMTLLVEKCNWAKSPNIEDAIRLLAFTKWTTEKSFKCITLVSAKPELAESIRHWCREKKKKFNWNKIDKKSNQQCLVRNFCYHLPLQIQALSWFCWYIMKRISLRGTGLELWKKSNSDIIFVSYLLNLLPRELKQSQFASRYWGPLPNLLRKKSLRTKWLHNYFPDPLLPSASNASTCLKKINLASKGEQSHVALDSFINFRVIYSTLKDWTRLNTYGILYNILKQNKKNFKKHLFPLFIKDWKKSFFGVFSISNMFYLNLFEEAMRVLPKHSLGFYLQENQSWELALIHAWKQASHGRLVGIPHSTVRFWDLRYFSDPRIYNENSKNKMPRPDLVAVNGPAMKAEYLKGHYPKNQIIQLEALRYLEGKQIYKKEKQHLKKTKKLKILVLGDILNSNNYKILNLLNLALKHVKKKVLITFKPHPANIIPINYFSTLNMKITFKPIQELSSTHDIAYTSSGTSAAVDAFQTGIPVISFLDPETLNYSPFRKNKKIVFVQNDFELSNKIIHHQKNQRKKIQIKIFNLNKNLSAWKTFLKNTK